MYIYHTHKQTSLHTFAWRVHFVSTKKRNTTKNELFCKHTVQILKVSLTFRRVLYSRIGTHTQKHTHTHIRVNEYRVGTSLRAFCTLQIYVCVCMYVCIYAVLCDCCCCCIISIFYTRTLLTKILSTPKRLHKRTQYSIHSDVFHQVQ